MSAFVIECVNQTSITNAVIDQETSQMMEHRYLSAHKNPKTRAIQNKSAANEIVRLFQGLGKGNDGDQRINGTDAFSSCLVQKCQIEKQKT